MESMNGLFYHMFQQTRFYLFSKLKKSKLYIYATIACLDNISTIDWLSTKRKERRKLIDDSICPQFTTKQKFFETKIKN